MAECPYCGEEICLRKRHADGKSREVVREAAGVIKKEVMYSCPNCHKVLGFAISSGVFDEAAMRGAVGYGCG